ncbi:putative blue light photoreceptor, partial [Mycena albidolilacea]
MSFEYLYHHQPPYAAAAVDDEQRPTGGIQFQFPEYLLDAPPTLAPGGGAEALHPAQAAQWFANNGFDHRAQYPQYNPVQDAFHSLESLHGAFPTTYHQQPSQWALNASPPPDEPSPLTASGLPVYSQSGFDVVSLISRVQNRATPSIRLGPVDFTTSFIVVDVRRHDDPIVYCSPSFCTLTGYSERAIVGRNCRFLQAPPSASVPLAKGDARRHTSLSAVRTLAKAVGGRKEAQVSVVNYRADGSAFVNLVSLVPLFGEHVDDPSPHAECVWYVGFQIDLTKASEGIVERVRDGTYYSGAVVSLQAQQQQPKAKAIEPPVAPQTRERRAHPVPAPRVAPLLARLLRTPAFLASCGIHMSQPAVSSTGTNAVAMTGLPPDPSSHALHSLLLEQLPDFVHVLSLKGAFLYVAPAVTRVLGWAPAELVGRALADVCFSKDVVSVGRALKEASLPVDGVRIDASKDEDGTPNNSSNSNSKATTPAANPHATNNTVVGGSGAGPPAALTPAE